MADSFTVVSLGEVLPQDIRAGAGATLSFHHLEPLEQPLRQGAVRAGKLDDLRVPPGNRLEALKGDRAGQHSIRVNDQFRVCFVWAAEGPEDVEIVDYH